MPYIITTTKTLEMDDHGATDTATAVATLREAREAAKTAIIDGPARWGVDAHIIATYHLPREGGTVGPLPDGTLIDVRPATLAEMVGSPVAEYNERHTAEIIAAFNE